MRNLTFQFTKKLDLEYTPTRIMTNEQSKIKLLIR